MTIYMSESNELGKQGEEIAVTHLLKLGYIILDKNWRAGRNEIDIIAKDKDISGHHRSQIEAQ